MGKRYLRSIVTDFQTLTASADITPVDLPVNPISHLVLTLALTKNVAAAATNLGRLMMPIIQQITDCSIRHRGENIIQGSLEDLAVTAFLQTGVPPAIGETAQADNEIQFVALTIPFGRRLYDGNEAFPATQRGNLRFHMTAGAISSLYDAASWSLEAIEMIEDTPKQFLKYTTSTRTITATGRQRIPLPIGNPLLGVVLFDPSDETDATNSYAFGKVKLLKDNVEQYYAESNWESLRATLAARVPNWHLAFGHRHAQAATDTDTGEELHTIADRAPAQYGLLDFDPMRDGANMLDTAGAASLDVDINSDVSTGTVRLIPIELVTIGAGK